MDDNRAVEILLIEDSASDTRLIEECFGSAETPNRVHSVADGEKALEFLHRGVEFADAPRPDLIILDLDLPKVGGLDILRAVKANDDLKSIPVIVLTASAIEEDVHRAYELQASSYFSKPTDLDGLYSLVGSIEQHWLRHVTLPSDTEFSVSSGQGTRGSVRGS
jgi:CheY-like chemotaxis protein